MRNPDAARPGQILLDGFAALLARNNMINLMRHNEQLCIIGKKAVLALVVGSVGDATSRGMYSVMRRLLQKEVRLGLEQLHEQFKVGQLV